MTAKDADQQRLNWPRIAGWSCLLAAGILCWIVSCRFGFHVFPASFSEFFCDVLSFLLVATGISLAMYDRKQ